MLVRGLLLGFSIAAPVGPIGLLCIRRTLAYGRWVGLLSGLGAATADGCYGAIAAFGLTLVSQFLAQMVWLRVVGGLFLCYLGAATFFAKPAAADPAKLARTRLAGAYFSTLVLTLTNPATILSFVLIFAGLAPAGLGYTQAAVLVAGTFLGSALWWILLSFGVSLLRQRLTVQGLRWLNRGFGLLIFGFGIAALGLSFGG